MDKSSDTLSLRRALLLLNQGRVGRGQPLCAGVAQPPGPFAPSPTSPEAERWRVTCPNPWGQSQPRCPSHCPRRHLLRRSGQAALSARVTSLSSQAGGNPDTGIVSSGLSVRTVLPAAKALTGREPAGLLAGEGSELRLEVV